MVEGAIGAMLQWIFQFVAWVARRPALRIRIMEDEPVVGGLQFEVENASPTLASLMPTVNSTFWFPEKGRYRRGSAVYDVRELDRELQPFAPKRLTASPRTLPPGYGAAWFRVYQFRPRRGARARVRLRNAMLEPLGVWRFWFELSRFRLTGRVHRSRSSNVSDYQARKRSRGPH